MPRAFRPPRKARMERILPSESSAEGMGGGSEIIGGDVEDVADW